MKKVYVAGAISSDKFETCLQNIRKGIITGTILLQNGYAPFIPHLDYQTSLVQDKTMPVDLYYKYDLEWLSVCDKMVVIPGWENSVGVKAEIQFAKEHNIPIVYLTEEFYETKRIDL